MASFDAVKKAFCEFIENVPFYGLAVMCIDHPEVQSVLGRIRDRRIVTYGFSALADVRADNVEPMAGGSRFDVLGAEEGRRAPRRSRASHVPIPGRHNVLNALAAVCVALELGISTTRRSFAGFEPVRRRQAALHPRRRDRRRDRDRRLCPSPDRDQSGARGGARRRRRSGSSRSSSRTASLAPAAI